MFFINGGVHTTAHHHRSKDIKCVTGIRYYKANRSNELDLHAATQVDLTIIVLSEKHETGKINKNNFYNVRFKNNQKDINIYFYDNT